MDKNSELLKIYESQLNQMSLFELRHIAREAGVPKPTKPKKEVLIAHILAIKTGKTEPAPTSRLGRPVKPIGEKVMDSPKPFTTITVTDHNADGSVYGQKRYFVVAESDK